MKQDKRSHARVALEIPVSCERLAGLPISGTAKDLGLGGIFIECDEQLPFGTAVLIIARMPHTKTDLRLPGIVRWTKPSGFGVQFALLGARETNAILTAMK